ncbi:unnamed protein product [Heligmosomoides polygyrus]|uniref:Secreted protein n=1 Tax=Heligmosomoides polygyrus TaxID=6339 RepID=A0A183FF29_HELPZ|nr:unnamed protein product [Heligmosomoides polygyrus]
MRYLNLTLPFKTVSLWMGMYSLMKWSCPEIVKICVCRIEHDRISIYPTKKCSAARRCSLKSVIVWAGTYSRTESTLFHRAIGQDERQGLQEGGSQKVSRKIRHRPVLLKRRSPSVTPFLGVLGQRPLAT